jgi:hypothetical protein
MKKNQAIIENTAMKMLPLKLV